MHLFDSLSHFVQGLCHISEVSSEYTSDLEILNENVNRGSIYTLHIDMSQAGGVRV